MSIIKSKKSLILTSAGIFIGLLLVAILIPDNQAVQPTSSITASQQTDVTSTTTDSDAPTMECPGIEFVTASFESWVTDYRAANPDVTIEEEQEDWNKLLIAMNCEEFTTDNIRKSIDDLQ